MLALLSIAAVLALLLLAWTHRSAPPSVEASGQATPAEASRPTSATSQARAATAPSLSLPPADIPIGQVADTLQARADAGDSKAACRLGLELLRCRGISDEYLGHIIGNSEERERQVREKGDLQAATLIAQRRLHLQQTQASCRNVPETLRERAHHYVRQAALAGEPDAMLRYASGESLNILGQFNRLRSPEFDAWRREAAAVLERALAAGRPEAVQLLAEAYRPTDGATTSVIGWLIPDDPVQAQAYALLQQRLSGGISPAGQQAPADLDDAGRLQAEALAQEWQQRHFAGAMVDPERVVLGMPPLLDPSGYAKHTTLDERFCEAGKSAATP